MDVLEKISKLTIRQKAELLTGKNFWQTKDFPELNVKSVFLADGPHGLRKQASKPDHLGLNKSLPATCFPTAAAMANSWNEELGENLGKAIGEEAAAQGVNVVLGPGTNMKRNPLCGRNFEYFSEDPYLAGKLSAAYIRGIQDNGTAACVKHFAANNQELRRMSTDSVVDERTLREIYLTAFEIAVKEGKVKAIMSSYNKVNGTYANENTHLLRDILRGEWGFDGVVVSDWMGSNNRVEGVLAGSDLEMPYCKYSAEDVVAAVESGKLDVKYVDECVERILKLSEAASLRENVGSFDEKAHHVLARKCAEESIVLLENDGVLPIKNGERIVFIGDFAQNPRYQGAGSSAVNPTFFTSALQAAKDTSSGLNVIGFGKGFDRYGKESQSLITKAVKLAKSADVTVFFAGLDELTEAEGLDRTDIKIPQNQIEVFRQLRQISKKLVVVLTCGSAVETEWCRSADALIYQCLSGQAGAEAIINVLNGKVNPSGKLAETFPVNYGDCASSCRFPAEGMTSEYREGPYIGYRYFDTANIPVSFPFGHGLSYTTFEYSDLKADETGVTFTITNTGSQNGAEIAQLYVGKRDGKIFRPLKELKGFAKAFIDAGESKRVTIPFDDKAFRYFNIKTGKWETEEGEYQLYIGASSVDIRLSATLFMAGTTDIMPYEREELPSYFSGKVADVCDSEFEKLLGRPVPEAEYKFYKKNRMVIDENSTVSDLRYSRRWVGRAFSATIRFSMVFFKKFGNRSAANTIASGLLNQPIRGIAKFLKLSRRQMEKMLKTFNGRTYNQPNLK